MVQSKVEACNFGKLTSLSFPVPYCTVAALKEKKVDIDLVQFIFSTVWEKGCTTYKDTFELHCLRVDY